MSGQLILTSKPDVFYGMYVTNVNIAVSLPGYDAPLVMFWQWNLAVELRLWCVENFGINNPEYYFVQGKEGKLEAIKFFKTKDAALFVLTWQGHPF